MNKKLSAPLTGLSLLALVSLQATIASADPAVNRLLASQCAQCHGTNGYSRSQFESIAGEEAKDMFEDLSDMKGEDAPENIMDHQALGYTDEQIRRIGAYYAGLPEDDPASSADEAEEERENKHEEEREYEEEHEKD